MIDADTDHITPVWACPFPRIISGICGAVLTVTGITTITITIGTTREAPEVHAVPEDLAVAAEADPVPAASAAAVSEAEAAAVSAAVDFPAVIAAAASVEAASAAVAAEDDSFNIARTRLLILLFVVKNHSQLLHNL